MFLAMFSRCGDFSDFFTCADARENLSVQVYLKL